MNIFTCSDKTDSDTKHSITFVLPEI